jgi:DNA-binding transcriptional ArsR family regulator
MAQNIFILKYMLKYSDPLDRIFHALSDPARRLMVDRLVQGPASVGELAEPLKMSLPGVFQHLQVLEESGLVRTEKIGRVRMCQIDTVVMRQAEEWFRSRRTPWEKRLDRLAGVLGEETE